MRKVFCLTVAILLIAAPVFAKSLEQGTIAFSARTSGLDFMSMKQDVKAKTPAGTVDVGEFNDDSWSIDLNMEYYFMQNVGVGLVFNYDKSDFETDAGDVKTDSWLIGPQLVYNFSVSDNFSIPVFGVLGYASMDPGNGDDLTGWGWALGGGGRWFLAPVVSLDGYLAYQQQYLDDGVEIDVSGWIAQVGFSVYLGGN